MFNPRLFITLLLAFNTALAANHQLQVDLHPQTGTLKASDRIELPAACQTLRLQLSSNLQITRISDSFKQTARHANDSWQTLELKRISNEPLNIHYHGKIQHPVNSSNKANESGGVLSSRGWIGEQGVYLGPESGWYPRLLDCDHGLTTQLDTHNLQVHFPDDQNKQWHSLSQGNNPGQVNHWTETNPQQGLYLLAARWNKYELGRSRVWLRSPDPVLAQRYLQASERYLAQYELLLGAYPYAHFTLAENFWESGFGMPGFTLLGSQVIRLPFIVNSSFPHEILHNWFGNGVYVDYQQGNWSEALTTYLADHWIKEKQGQGKDYRFRQLQRYATHSRKQAQDEAPLSAFTARHNGLSQAIGYSKGLMTFHMIRRQIGDTAFLQALRSFYKKYRFRIASWQDLRLEFEAASGQKLNNFFEAWIQRNGAPQLSATATTMRVNDTSSANSYRTTIHLKQTQADPAWPIPVQLALQTTDGNWQQQRILMNSKDRQVTLLSKTQAQQLQIDPEHDIFRRLTTEEIPISLGRLNTAGETTTIIVPDKAARGMTSVYRQLAEQWAADPAITWQLDRPELALPKQGKLWIFGKNNRKLHELQQHQQLSIPSDPQFNASNSAPNNAWVISGQRRINLRSQTTAQSSTQPIGWLIATNPTQLKLATRLFKHYGRYGYVGFIEGSRQRIKGNWPASQSPLNIPLSSMADLSAQPPVSPALHFQTTQQIDPKTPNTTCD